MPTLFIHFTRVSVIDFEKASLYEWCKKKSKKGLFFFEIRFMFEMFENYMKYFVEIQRNWKDRHNHFV